MAMGKGGVSLSRTTRESGSVVSSHSGSFLGQKRIFQCFPIQAPQNTSHCDISNMGDVWVAGLASSKYAPDSTFRRLEPLLWARPRLGFMGDSRAV